MSEERRERKRRLRGAAQAARAAALILRDRRCDPADALPLLLTGWERLRGVLGEDEPGAEEARLREERPTSRKRLVAERKLLARRVRERGGPSLRPWSRAVAPAVAALVAALAVAAGAAAVVTVESPTMVPWSENGWRATYYPDLLFLGDPFQQRDGSIAFRWGRERPFPDFPRDGFSVRWDTCLDLPSDQELELRIASDDGSRLYIDGEKVVDNWGDHAFRWRSRTRELSRGRHHVLVEYYERDRDARVEVVLRRPGPPATPVPASWLWVPDGPHHADPCRPSE